MTDLAAQLQSAYALLQAGNLDAAIAAYTRIVSANQTIPEAWNNLGVAFRRSSRGSQAVEAALRATQLAPRVAATHDNLGAALLLAGRPLDAITPLRRALELEPGRADAFFHLGNAFYLLGRTADAMDSYRRVLELNPRHGDAISNLGTILHLCGRVEEALEMDRRAIVLATDRPRAHSRMLFTMNFVPGMDRQAVFSAHRDWGKAHADNAARPWRKDRPAGAKVRIGYVSPDLAEHAVATFFEPLLANHDRSAVEAFCYSNTLRPDGVTSRFRALAHTFRDITTMNDSAAASLIRADGIDVLVDLAGHTDGNRLGVFALRPAPVQMTYLGYPNTVGTTAIDFRITDAIADPPDDADNLHAEKLIRLNRTAWCYSAPVGAADVAVSASRSRAVTFGSFNNLAKLNGPLLALWAKVLHAVPGSRMIVKAIDLREPAWRGRVRDGFVAGGIEPGRVDVVGPTDTLREHFAGFAHVDIALDTFPYHGTKTTCDALWMGVPVVTRRGDRHVSRVSASLLHAVGLGDLIADSAQAYVDIAVALARDAGRRADLRASLRPTMQKSPLMDPVGLARAIEEAYRDALG